MRSARADIHNGQGTHTFLSRAGYRNADLLSPDHHFWLATRGRSIQANGIENYPLYEWTKKTVEDPAKKAKYTKSFALYVGGEEVYAKDKADALEAELEPLVGGSIVAEMFKYDSDPAHNPQPPRPG